KGIGRFSRFILRMILVTLVFVFVANILIKGESVDIIELVVFSIALVVSVVPEALPVVTTVSLSKGALQLAQHDVVVNGSPPSRISGASRYSVRTRPGP